MSIKKELQKSMKEEETRSRKSASVPEEKTLSKAAKKCIVCGKSAEYCMRGLPENSYCKPCAKDYFKLLGYLDRL